MTDQEEAGEAGTCNASQPVEKEAGGPPLDDKKEKEEEPPKDEEGLQLKYDVVICGTGLIQSILAAALTRAGKTVLHCDGNDHYGELDTVWTFEYLQELIDQQQQKNNYDGPKPSEREPSKENTANDGTNSSIALSEQGSYQCLKFHSSGSSTQFPVAKVGTIVQTPYGQGKIAQIKFPTSNGDNGSNGHLAISLENWTMADGSHPSVYIGISNHQLDEYNGITASPEQALEECMQKQYPDIVSQRTLAARQILQHQSRSLALDVTPQLLYASGTAVQGFLTSGVAEHLEFQTMQAVYWLNDSNNDNNKTKAATLERVPCSKGDVFQSPLLPPLDKRRFMKFFQLAMDYATEREVQQSGANTEQVSSENAAADADNTEEGVMSLNERQLNQGRSLARPQNKAVSQKDLTTLHDCMDKNMDFDTYLQEHAKLSPQLRQLIRHALALEIGSDKDSDSTVSLSTKEGMGRLCDHLKALGRYGTTAFLTPLYGAGEMSQFFCRSAAVYGATYLLRRVPTQVNLIEDTDGSSRHVESVTICSNGDGNFGGLDPVPKEKKIQASHVVLAQEARLHTTSQKRLARRVSVLRGNVVPDTTRSVIVIPPYGVGNHKYAIHGLVLDESAKVAPAGCSLLHLTTVVDDSDAAVDSGDDLGCLQKAVQVILGSSSSSSSSSEPAVDEIYHATFSYGIYDDSDDAHIGGLHKIARPPMHLAVDEAFVQAQRIFRQVCGPEEVFLALSPQMEAKLKEQLQDAYRGPNQVEDDAEQHVLESAMEML